MSELGGRGIPEQAGGAHDAGREPRVGTAPNVAGAAHDAERAPRAEISPDAVPRPGGERRPHAVIVLNPVKSAAPLVRRLAATILPAHGYGPPEFSETLPDSPGHDQAAAAVAAGADLVIAAGGDGTVRAVASALAGTGVPMGIVPMGTANLLALNLDLPRAGGIARAQSSARARALGRADPAAAAGAAPPVPERPAPAALAHWMTDALTVAAGGEDRPIDVARLTAYGPDKEVLVSDEVFTVIAGIGFDAEMINAADPVMKRRFGWPAYFMSGIKHLGSRRIRARVTVRGHVRKLTARTIMVANCGLLPAGLTLVPSAVIDDGRLDAALVDTRAGLIGWFSLAAQVLLQGLGLRALPRFAVGRLWHYQSRRISVVADEPTALQLDGDPWGQAQAIRVRIDPAALQVRVRPAR
ncbi:MAG: NAD(+)/NADH kinase [Bifidobacteriaceae bacterium]|nr:NAD(+)/NADH kinase [Bifidobacteriaceae bacterium]